MTAVRLRQEGPKFKGSLGYGARFCFREMSVNVPGLGIVTATSGRAETRPGFSSLTVFLVYFFKASSGASCFT